jgi:hypothetical protein
MLVCFLVFHQLTRKHLALLMNMVSGFKSFSEAPRLTQKCGTHRSDSLVRVVLVLDMIEILPPLGKYKYDT